MFLVCDTSISSSRGQRATGWLAGRAFAPTNPAGSKFHVKISDLRVWRTLHAATQVDDSMMHTCMIH